jgi:hypothetical protein
VAVAFACLLRDRDLSENQPTLTKDQVREALRFEGMLDGEKKKSSRLHLFHRMCTGRRSRSQTSLTVIRCGAASRVLAPTRLLGPPPRHLIAPFRELRHHLKGMVGRSRNAQLGAFPHDVTVEKVDLAWFAAREILRGR